MAERVASARRRWPTAGALACLAVLVGYPLFELARGAVDVLPGALGDAFGGAGAGQAVWNTVWTSALVAILATGLGAGAAVVVERSPDGPRRSLRLVVLLPLLVPPFVSALAWERTYGPGGAVDDLAGVALPGLVGPVGVVAVMVVNTMPLAYLVVAAGLATGARPEHEWAARASGASPRIVLRRITLPLLRPSLIAGGALAFAAGVNAFGVPVVLGLPAGFGTITTRIYRDLALSASPAAFGRVVILALTLAAVAAIAVGATDAVQRRRPPAPRAGVGAEPTGSRGLARSSRARIAVWVYATITLLIPLAGLCLTALTRGVGLPPTPGNWTLGNFREALGGSFWGPLGRSLLLASLAATAVVGLGWLLASASRRQGGGGIGTAVIAAFAVPGSALAVAMILAYGPWLRDTLLIILLAYLAKFWALGHRAAAGSLGALPSDLVRAARVSGAGPVTAARRIVVPLLAPAIVAGWLLAFLFGLHELTISSLLYGPGTDTLAVVILNLRQLGDVPVTAALAVLLTVPGLVVAALMVRRTARPGMGLR